MKATGSVSRRVTDNVDAHVHSGRLTSRRFSSTFSMPMLSRRAPTVPVDSSQARRPRPGRTSCLAVAQSSSAYFSREFSEVPARAVALGAAKPLAVEAAAARVRAMIFMMKMCSVG